MNGFGIKQYFISSFEHTLNIFFHDKVSTYIVQTKSMCSVLSKSFLKNAKVGPKILPFIPSSIEITDALNTKKDWDFVYISSGDPHKNHRNLIESWKILASENIFPTLALTVGKEYPELCKVIDIAKLKSGLKISNLGKIDHTAAIELYYKSRALIYPSVSESFGLPLIEASIIGTPIIAGELDFVRDVCIPSETFDPNSPNSIARSIKRFLQVSETERSFMHAKKFWEHLL
jgi:glycosyltransferase involved in cell wall biosynthesis